MGVLEGTLSMRAINETWQRPNSCGLLRPNHWHSAPLFPKIPNIDELVKSHKLDGTVKGSRCKARESLGVRRTYKYVGMTKDEAQHSRWAFHEAVKYWVTFPVTFTECLQEPPNSKPVFLYEVS